MAEGYGNGDQRRLVGLYGLGRTFTTPFCLLHIGSCSRVVFAAAVNMLSLPDTNVVLHVQELIDICTTMFIDVASTNRRSSGAKRLRILSGSRDGIKFLMIPNLRLLNGKKS